MLWPRGIGLDAAYMGLTFLREVAQVRHVLDPFCGVGTVLAMANAMGMDRYCHTLVLSLRPV